MTSRSSGAQPVQSRRRQRVQCLRDLERVQRPGRPVDVALAYEQAAVEQHPHRLDRVQRHALRACEHSVAVLLRKPRHEAVEERAHRLVRERLERQRRRVPHRAGPGRMPVRQIGAREREHENRVVARPLEQVLDELEQRRIRPLEVLEHEHDRPAVAYPLEEEPPRAEQLLLLARLPLLQPQQVREARLHPLALLGVRQKLGQGRLQLLPSRRRLLRLCDPDLQPHHLDERPVGDALAVRETAASMPVRRLREPVEVLVQLPGEPGLADPGDPHDREQVRLPLLRGGVKQLLDQA